MTVHEGDRRVAVVTGASSGIGAATVLALARAGFRVFGGARRLERVRRVVARISGPSGAEAMALDVTEAASVDAFVAALPERVHLLVNNAGGALGLEPIEQAVDEHWRTMFETNVLGTLRVTRALLGRLIASGDGHVITVGSTAGLEVYRGGAGYTAAKHGERVLTETLRLELLGRPVRVTEVAPGLVETEFSVVRFGGDRERAAAVYRGMTPLAAEDVADAIAWAATRPSHVNVDKIVLRPRDQATSTEVFRREE
ncbi:MAG TPA: SDR family NAD(P)-dependent oxidoreductase [Thermoanaerobaculia bacterium]|nr:SDR family NAD(P)-dependent oxidoreductase [Thermoanaerobaculia bacterium]